MIRAIGVSLAVPSVHAELAQADAGALGYTGSITPTKNGV